MSYQMAAQLQTFARRVINLALSELSFEVSFVLSSPFSFSALTARSSEHKGECGAHPSQASTHAPLM